MWFHHQTFASLFFLSFPHNVPWNFSKTNNKQLLYFSYPAWIYFEYEKSLRSFLKTFSIIRSKQNWNFLPILLMGTKYLHQSTEDTNFFFLLFFLLWQKTLIPSCLVILKFFPNKKLNNFFSYWFFIFEFFRYIFLYLKKNLNTNTH